MSLSKCAKTMGSYLNCTIQTTLPFLYLKAWPRSSKGLHIITFAGAGAHHHNGMTEHAIGTMTNTIMLHAAIHWPNATVATQWLMVVMHATYLYDHMPCLETGIFCSC
jgi:hypothetical protein